MDRCGFEPAYRGSGVVQRRSEQCDRRHGGVLERFDLGEADSALDQSVGVALRVLGGFFFRPVFDRLLDQGDELVGDGAIDDPMVEPSVRWTTERMAMESLPLRR